MDLHDASPAQADWRTASCTYFYDWFREFVFDYREHFLYGDAVADLEEFAMHCENETLAEKECTRQGAELLLLLKAGQLQELREAVDDVASRSGP